MITRGRVEALDGENRQMITKLEQRALFFGVVLIVSHLLQIKPSDLNAGGFHIVIRDVAVIHGALALGYLYYLWAYVMTVYWGQTINAALLRPHQFRTLIKSARRPFRSPVSGKIERRNPAAVKRSVRRRWTGYIIFVLPVVWVLIAILLAAFELAIADAWGLLVYIFTVQQPSG